MKDFIKEKITFAIALLATLFTINPIIAEFGSLGFEVFSFNFTIEQLYLIFLALLGLAVYCFSWQFLTKKGFGVMRALGDAMYGLAIVIPPAYMLLFLFSRLLTVLDLQALTRVAVPIAGAFMGFAVALLSKKIISRLRTIENRSEANAKEKQELDALSRAHQLLLDGYYDLAILELFKAIEAALKKSLLEAQQQIDPYKFDENLRKAIQLNLIREKDLQTIERLRQMRNQVAHGQMTVKREETQKLFEAGKEVLSFLSGHTPATSIASFNWLMRNYDEALRILKGRNKVQVIKTLNYLLDAWKNRDGAIGLEISEFFVQALLTNTKSMIDAFRTHKQEFHSFLERLPYVVFTDYFGNAIDKLKQLKIDLIERLKVYESGNETAENKKIAHKIRKIIEATSVREIY
jgi:uncharacterized protein YutE (UPF0331/DUF86 family)